MLVSRSLLQTQPDHLLSEQLDTAKCGQAAPANTQAANQGGNSVPT